MKGVATLLCPSNCPKRRFIFSMRRLTRSGRDMLKEGSVMGVVASEQFGYFWANEGDLAQRQATPAR